MSSLEKPSGLGPPAWQNTIRLRLMERQAEAELQNEVLDQYRRLSKTARDLKDRNRALLRGGAGSGSGSGPSSGEGSPVVSRPSPILSHLDAQLSTLRAELSTVYRTQAASQNRQLALSDALRDRDEEVRGLREEVRELRDARDTAVRKEKDWDERWKMRTKDLETLNDEILSLNVELSGMAQNNAALKADNASLLQRWLDKMNLTAEEMNEDFEKETTKHVGSKESGVPRDFQQGGKI
ncbi:autophagy-related protein 16 [Kockovaella imperatae]|uniref:Autophagy-related protein 16 n=1 Tax=Kockovaella imperatae TaxID=4999 RepID=A0A1Y1UCK0_9TREE|nr:autophagy-related protein 16 [Kockovaella imperatae]ORX34795.1 autophagy-related protein 16 [Kockovaella imperatae]